MQIRKRRNSILSLVNWNGKDGGTFPFFVHLSNQKELLANYAEIIWAQYECFPWIWRRRGSNLCRIEAAEAEVGAAGRRQRLAIAATTKTLFLYSHSSPLQLAPCACVSWSCQSMTMPSKGTAMDKWTPPSTLLEDKHWTVKSSHAISTFVLLYFVVLHSAVSSG